MKCLFIITRENNEFDGFWGLDNNLNEFVIEWNGYKIILLKKAVRKTIESYSTDIENKVSGMSGVEVGVIFHKLNGDSDAVSLKHKLTDSSNVKFVFCKWYSSTINEFWNESNRNDGKPYNNFRRAWKDEAGDKEETFKALWNFFVGDTKLEELLKPFEKASPFETTTKEGKALKEAQKELQVYVDELLKNKK